VPTASPIGRNLVNCGLSGTSSKSAANLCSICGKSQSGFVAFCPSCGAKQ
jgi:hypothetical protein